MDFTFYCDTCDKEKPCKGCNYQSAKHQAIYSDNVLANYDYLYHSNLYTDNWECRDLLILDEAHKFESFIMGKVTRSLSEKECKEDFGLDIFSTIHNGDNLSNWVEADAWIPILERVIDAIPLKQSKIKSEINSLERSRQTKTRQLKIARLKRKIKSLDNKLRHLKSFIHELMDNGDKWVVLLPSLREILNTKFDCKVEFKPITAEKYTDTILELGNKRLFLTATIGDENKFCEWLGLDHDKTHTIYQKSNFPVENRPIYKMYVRNFSGSTNGVPHWKTKDGLDTILKICMEYPDQKGIIHTTSHSQTYWILKELSQYLPLWKIEANPKNNWNNLSREDVVKRFIHTDEPAILVGAGIKDGVDFKDDACRFQILYKTPFPAFDAQVRKRNKLDKVWWHYQAVMDAMQSYGRGVRSETDYCDFYILDQKFEQLLNKWNYLFNDYFLEAIV